MTVAAVAATVAVVVGVLLFTPLLDGSLEADANPGTSYDDALARADDLMGIDGDDINPVCRSRVYDQGGRSEVAVVLLHGFTNCPEQWDAVAQAYVDAGYSVVVPRLPGHGQQDRLSGALSSITPQQLVDTADLAVDVAAGLGDEVRVVGLSGGGTLAGWLGANRDEVTEVTLVAPLVAPKVLPEVLVGPVSRAFRHTPDISLWWDGDKKETLDTPPYAYPRYTLRSLGAFLAVGRATQRADPQRATDLGALVVVTNENDDAVSNAGVAAMADSLDVLLVDPSDRVDYVFSADQGFKHDVVDPEGENADRLDEIYPILGPLLGLPDLSAP